MQSESVIVPEHTWLTAVETDSGESVSLCYQCKKCSCGCPVVYAMDYQPNQIIHMIKMGQKEELLTSTSIWLCAACETCTTRCPNDIDIAKIIDAMKMDAVKAGVKIGEKRVPHFHKSVLLSVKTTGRLYELGMIGLFMMRSGDIFKQLKAGTLFGQAKLGLQMFKKGKLKLMPGFIKRRKEIRKMFKKQKRGESS